MSRCIRQHTDFLKYISKCGHKQRLQCIKHASPQEIKAILEIVLNTAKGNVPIDKNKIRKLQPFKQTFHKIASRKLKRLSSQKKIILQRGGAIVPALLATVLPYIVSLLNRSDV